MVNKADITANKPALSNLTTVANGDTVSANIENSNNQSLMNPLITVYNWIIDSALEAGLTNVFSVIQTFSAGIKTNIIDPLTTNANIIFGIGTGKLYKNAASTANELLSQGEISTLINGASGAVAMTGSTSSTAGTAGLTAANPAGTQWKALRGDATWGTLLPLNTTVQTGNFNVTIGQTYMVDSSGGIFTVTFPASATAGDMFGIIDVGGACASNNVTFSRNGLEIMDLSENMTFDVNYGKAYFEYTTGRGWVLVK